jgi:hypothetical protein
MAQWPACANSGMKNIIRKYASLTPVVLLAVAGGSVIGCGGEPRFTTEEFVDGVVSQGVKLRLGEPLATEEEGKELYAVELAPVGRPRLDSEGERVTSGGSLSVYEENEGDPDAELKTCEMAADLLCYRAANVVVVLEGGGLEARQLGVAMQKLAGS